MEEKEPAMAPQELLVAIGLTGGRKSKYILKWAMDKFLQENNVTFKLLHVYRKITSVPTPLGSWLPIAQVREDVADTYRQEVEWKKKKSLLPYQKILKEQKVRSDIVMLESDDIAMAISLKVANLGIRHLVIGASSTSTSIFSRKILSLKKIGENLSSVMLETTPDFCSIYVVADGKLVHVRPAEPEPATIIVDDLKSWSSASARTSSSSYSVATGHLLKDRPSQERCSVASSSLLQNTTTSSRSKKELNYHDNSSVASRSSSSNGLWVLDRTSSGSSFIDCQLSTISLADTTLTGSFVSTPYRGSLVSTCTSPSVISAGTPPIGSLVTTTTEGQSLSGSSMGALAGQISELETLMIDLRLRQEINALTQNSDFNKKLSDFKKRMEDKQKLKEQQAKESTSSGKKEHKAAERDAEGSAENAGRYIPKNIVYHFKKFTWKEILEATSSFSDEFKIGSGSYGTVYKCKLQHTTVAIKVLHSKDNVTNKQFLQELEILSMIRHPHLLLLLGAVPEECCLVYEYMENGSLDDRLFRKNNTPPIPWYDRFRICWEVASALAFLHSTTPNPIIHRDLKPANIMLDQHLVSKIGDAGLGTMITVESELMTNVFLKTLYKETSPVGTLCYIDPEYQRTGRVSTKSDIYALGVVILQLLTAQPAVGIAYLVEDAIDEGALMEVLDSEAGQWPPKETLEMALLGVQCVALRGRDRPGLREKILPTLERLKDIADSAKELALSSSTATPPLFICPILKDIMEDPYVAADGYTYDRKAIEQWLIENNTSPTTFSPLPHKFIMPNYTLLEAIKQWKSKTQMHLK